MRLSQGSRRACFSRPFPAQKSSSWLRRAENKRLDPIYESVHVKYKGEWAGRPIGMLKWMRSGCKSWRFHSWGWSQYNWIQVGKFQSRWKKAVAFFTLWVHGGSAARRIWNFVFEGKLMQPIWKMHLILLHTAIEILVEDPLWYSLRLLFVYRNQSLYVGNFSGPRRVRGSLSTRFLCCMSQSSFWLNPMLRNRMFNDTPALVAHRNQNFISPFYAFVYFGGVA